MPISKSGGTDFSATLTPSDAEQAVIQDIKAMRSQGMTLKLIAVELTSRGVPTKTGKFRR